MSGSPHEIRIKEPCKDYFARSTRARRALYDHMESISERSAVRRRHDANVSNRVGVARRRQRPRGTHATVSIATLALLLRVTTIF